MAPRSSATTLRPASVSSLARMPPVQPNPTMTTSTSLSFVVMAAPLLAHVRDAEWLIGKRLAAILRDVVAMHGDDARKADDGPSRLVAVAAVNRIGIHALDYRLIKRGPEHPYRQAVVEADLCGREADQDLLPLVSRDPVERVAIGLAAVRVGGRNACAIQLGWCQWQLVALRRGAQLPRPLHIKTVALAPAAGQRAVDIDIDAEIGAFRADFVVGYHVIDQRLDEGRFVEIKKGVSGRFGGGRRGALGWLFGLSGIRGHGDRRGACCGRATHHGGFQKIAPVESLLFHGCFPWWPECCSRRLY